MVDGINFNGNVQGPKNGGQIKQKNTAALPNVFAGYFNKSTATTTAQAPQNDTLADLQGTLSPAVFAALLKVQDNFSGVPDTVLRNTKNENLVIKDSDYIPDREYAEAEV